MFGMHCLWISPNEHVSIGVNTEYGQRANSIWPKHKRFIFCPEEYRNRLETRYLKYIFKHDSYSNWFEIHLEIIQHKWNADKQIRIVRDVKTTKVIIFVLEIYNIFFIKLLDQITKIITDCNVNLSTHSGWSERNEILSERELVTKFTVHLIRCIIFRIIWMFRRSNALLLQECKQIGYRIESAFTSSAQWTQLLLL